MQNKSGQKLNNFRNIVLQTYSYTETAPASPPFPLISHLSFPFPWIYAADFHFVCSSFGCGLAPFNRANYPVYLMWVLCGYLDIVTFFSFLHPWIYKSALEKSAPYKQWCRFLLMGKANGAQFIGRIHVQFAAKCILIPHQNMWENNYILGPN